MKGGVDLDIQAHRIARRLLSPTAALRHVAVTLQILQIANADGAAIILRLLLLLLLRLRLPQQPPRDDAALFRPRSLPSPLSREPTVL